MRTRVFLITLFSLVAGFLLGVKLSETIGIAGVLGFGRAVGIKYLSVYLAIAAAVAANLADAVVRRKAKKENE